MINRLVLGEDFFAFAAQETALPIPRLIGERARTSGQMRLFAELLRSGRVHGARIDCALPERTPLPRPDLRQYRVAIGPVAVLGIWDNLLRRKLVDSVLDFVRSLPANCK